MFPLSIAKDMISSSQTEIMLPNKTKQEDKTREQQMF